MVESNKHVIASKHQDHGIQAKHVHIHH